MINLIHFTDATTKRKCCVPVDRILSINETEDKTAFIELYFDNTGNSYGSTTTESFLEILFRLQQLNQNGILSILTKLGNEIILALKDIKK